MESVWVSEYGKLYKQNSTKQLKSEGMRMHASLSTEDFNDVLSLHEDETVHELKPVFKFSRTNGVDTLTAQNFVGVIRTASGNQIEILPKTSVSASEEAARDILIKMLVELRDSPFHEGVMANLHAHNMPLFELLIGQFLKHVGNIVRKGIARKYVDQEGNLVFLRGKLQLREHIKRNMIDQSRFYCEYDEYERNRPVNRLIKGALHVCMKVSRNTTNRQLCREYLFWFDQVPITKNYKSDFRAIKQDRFVNHYQKALPLCRLILARLNPLTKQGQNQCISVLFDMNRVFESYVASKLSTQFPRWHLKTQVRHQYLIEVHRGERKFGLKPDLEFSQGDFCVIADTKWKLIDEARQPYDIKQPDLYQMFAYAKKYLHSQLIKVVVLVYPATDNFTQPLKPFWFDRDRKEVLLVLPYDLESGELIGFQEIEKLRLEKGSTSSHEASYQTHSHAVLH